MDVEAVIRQVVEGSGLELVEAAMARERGRRILRVTLDRQGGLDLDAIAAASERISRRLDAVGYDPGPYELEVGSPGVERPLRRARDFERSVGERVKVKTADPVEGSRSLVGRLLGADRGLVRLATDAGEHEVPLEAIVSARTVVDWDEELRDRGRRR
jgi:ribosome maturation factor RimP